MLLKVNFLFNFIDFLIQIIFISGGKSEDGEILYVGRVNHQNTVTIGKVQPSHGVCYISFAGKEIKFFDYEILVYLN